jgi:hypothetical protein
MRFFVQGIAFREKSAQFVNSIVGTGRFYCAFRRKRLGSFSLMGYDMLMTWTDLDRLPPRKKRLSGR